MRNRNPGVSGEHGNCSPAHPGGGCEVVATQKLVSVLHAAPPETSAYHCPSTNGYRKRAASTTHPEDAAILAFEAGSETQEIE